MVSPIPFNNMISRTDAAALIPEEVSTAMLDKAVDQSAVLQLFRRVPVSRSQVRFPILSALPVAYWRNGDTGLVQTSEVNWTNKYMNIEEIDVIVPVPNNVIDDVEINVWDTMEPYLREAAARTLDSGVFFGVNAPATFPTNISAAALAAGNSDAASATAANGAGLGDIDVAYGRLEADGFEATGLVAATAFKGRLRASRDTTGQRTDPGRLAGNLKEVDGIPIVYPMKGLFPTGSGTGVYSFLGDWDQFVVGVRSDIEFEVLDQAVIQDNTGAIIYNLAQQRMKGVLLTFRVGWQVSNLINYDNPNEATRYPVTRLMVP